MELLDGAESVMALIDLPRTITWKSLYDLEGIVFDKLLCLTLL